jgi:hypothetical protein
MSNTYIYALVDPRDGQVRYVGKTVKKPEHRLAAHLCEAFSKERSNWHKSRWLRSLLQQNLKPKIQIFEEVSEEVASEAEQRWIAYGRLQGWRLTNLTDGGEGAPGCVPTLMSRLLRSMATKGCLKPLEHREKIRQALKGRRPSDLCLQRSLEKRRVDLPDTAIALMGTISDGEIARQFGVKPGTVSSKRRRLGICAFAVDVYTPEIVALMGKVSDREIARLIGRDPESVRGKRIRLGIPAFHQGGDALSRRK